LFAEPQYTGTGQRVFNVVLNGSTVLSNFDILTQVAPLTALNKQFQTTVTNGSLSIAVNGVVRRGILNGIQIVPSSQVTQTPTDPPPTNNPSGATGSSGSSTSSQALISINAGGSAYTATNGTQWAADEYSTGGEVTWTSSTITGTSDLYLYRSAREGLYTDFSYQIPVANGSYVVTLLLAESQYTAQGQRVFNVVANGATVLSNFDIMAHVPFLTALTEQFPVTVSNGSLSLAFNGVVRRAVVSGIQISPASGDPPPSSNTLTLNASPTSLSFLATAGGSNPAAQPLSISPSGTGTLSWTATKTQSWLSLSQTSGTGAATINVSVATSGLTAGPHSDTITVSAPGAAGSPALITVNFTVSAATNSLTLGVSPPSLTFSGTAGGSNPTADPITITITGTGSQSWTASKNASWLNLSQTSGSGSGSFNASVSLSGLGAGTYTDTITITDAGALGSPAKIGVTLKVAPAPPLTLSVAPTSLAFTGTAGGSNPAAQILYITTSGGTVSWTAGKTQSWLTLSPGSGSNSGSFSVTANISGLSQGSYSDTITVTALGATGSPTLIPVSFSVAPKSTGSGHAWYVSSTGSPAGNGSISSPWDIVTGFASRSVQPGDTIWVRGGSYSGGSGNVFYVRLVGTASQPITIRNYPGERAIIENWLQIGCCDQNPQPSDGAYVWVWGLEFWDSIPNGDRTGSTTGADITNPSVDTWAVGTKLINNIIHDTSGGPGVWKEAQEAEVYGNLMYYNGWIGPDRAHGHGLYTQNNTPTTLISDNISFDNFDEGMQFYGSSAGPVQDYNVVGNILAENGQISGSLNQSFLFAGGGANLNLNGITLSDNYTYNPASVSAGYTAFGYPWDTVNGSLSATGNVFTDGLDATDFWHWTSIVFENNQVYSPSNEVLMITGFPSGYSSYTFKNNSYYGGGRFLIGQGGPSVNTSSLTFPAWQSNTGLDSNSTYTSAAPTGVWTYVRPNKYEPGRANIVIYNWNLQSSVSVDVSSVLTPGTSYQIKDAENFFGNPVVSGVYEGGTVSIPMTGLSPEVPEGKAPITPPVDTAPQFGIFILLPQ
jgi:hypothetical protein